MAIENGKIGREKNDSEMCSHSESIANSVKEIWITRSDSLTK